MSILTLDLQEYTTLLTNVAKEEYLSSSIKNRTGRLLESIQVTVGGTEAEPEYILSFNDYGLFLDEGVAGTLSGASGQGYQGLQFKYSGRFKMIGGNLPYGARTNIYKFGLRPRPWISEAMNAIENVAVEQIERDLPQNIVDQIAEMINNVPPIEINL